MKCILLALSSALCMTLAHRPDQSRQFDSGLAVRDANDRGSAGDKKVLFAEDFESGDLTGWQEKREPVLVTEARPHRGKRCLEIPMHRGKDTGGHLLRWFMPGADSVYARFYVRFSSKYTYPHHFVTLMGNPSSDRWRGFGKAGKKPDGTYFSSGMESWFAWGKNPPPGELHLYSYFMDMEMDRKMNMYWGNSFFPPGSGKGTAAAPQRVIPALDKWQCWEFMIKANSAPNKADGEQAMWLDGKLAGRFTGIRWRSDINVKVNTFWLQHYGMDPGDPTRGYNPESQIVWFDDIVVATEYVGPVALK